MSGGAWSDECPRIVYRVATEGDRDVEQGLWKKRAVDSEFFHLSTASQKQETLRLYFSGQEVVVLTVDLEKVEGLRWDVVESRGGEKFAHLYDVPGLRFEWVVAEESGVVQEDGSLGEKKEGEPKKETE